jgi:hypothetical protein
MTVLQTYPFSADAPDGSGFTDVVTPVSLWRGRDDGAEDAVEDAKDVTSE